MNEKKGSKLNENLHHTFVFFALILISGCIAPMARTSYIKIKDSAEFGGGPILLKSVIIEGDTTSWLGFRMEEATYFGIEGNLRLGYGFSEHFGIDLTLNTLACAPIFYEGNNDLTGFYSIALGPKLRPWKSNDLFTLEIMNGGFLNLGWVHGWPAYGNEKISTWIAFGNSLPYVIIEGTSGKKLWKYVVPFMFSFSLARNYYFNGKRVSPNISIGIVYDLEQNNIDLGSIMLGAIWAP